MLEEVSDTARTNTHEHFHEVRTGNRVERGARFTCNRTREEGLARTRRSVQQHTLGDLRSHFLETLSVGQEVLDLDQLFDRLIGTGDVFERGLGHVFRDRLGLGLTEVHQAAAAALHLTEDEDHQQDEQRKRQEGDEQGDQQVLARDHDVVTAGKLAGVGLLLQEVLQFHTLAGDEVRPHFVTVPEGQFQNLITVNQGGGIDISGRNVGNGFAGVHLVGGADARDQARTDQNRDDSHRDPENRSSQETPHIHLSTVTDLVLPASGSGLTSPAPSANIGDRQLLYTCGDSVPTHRRFRYLWA